MKLELFLLLLLILNDKGEVIFLVGIEQDITKAKKIDQMKTEFISIVSHQLKTPLSAIRWFMEMLLNEDDNSNLKPEQKDFLMNIQELTLNMVSLVNSLLNISRIESGRIIIDPQPTDIKSFVDSVVKEIEMKAKEKNQKIDVKIKSDLPIVNIDKRLIREVILNILSNSIKYSPEKTKISLILDKKNEKEIIFKISDQGIGIPKKEQERVFSRFFRATNAVKKVTDGNGLGLYLVKTIIESSGGKIWFESEEGKGTTFYFTLPIKGMKPKKGEVYLS